MIVNTKMIFQLHVTAPELKLIRKALQQCGIQHAVQLETEINKRLLEARKQFVAAIDASIAVEQEVPNETAD